MKTFNRVDLSTVTGAFPPLTCYGIAYLGWPTLIVGPTASSKTLICRWLLLEMFRKGLRVGHADQEMGSEVTKAYYEAMGATPEEIHAIAYWDLPSPKLQSRDLGDDAEQRMFLNVILDEEIKVLLWDKLPDFLRVADLQENLNDAVNTWMAEYIEPIQGKVTSLIIDATGWEGKHSRGGSEKDYKVGLAWLVEVVDPPKKDHVGRVRWTCTKDRFGDVGLGAVVEFVVGGDGAGHVVCSMASAQTAHSKTDAEKREEAIEVVAEVVEGFFRTRHEQGNDARLSTNALKERLPDGYGSDILSAGIHRARDDPRFAVNAVDGPRNSLLYGYHAPLTSPESRPVLTSPDQARTGQGHQSPVLGATGPGLGLVVSASTSPGRHRVVAPRTVGDWRDEKEK